MCGRVKQLSWDEVRRVVEQLERGGALSSDPGWQATLFDRADARPMSVLAVVSGEKGTLRAQRMSWGFPVSWQASPVFNTRLESALAGGNMWELPLREHRCIVPVAAFFREGQKRRVRLCFQQRRAAAAGRRVRRGALLDCHDASQFGGRPRSRPHAACPFTRWGAALAVGGYTHARRAFPRTACSRAHLRALAALAFLESFLSCSL